MTNVLLTLFNLVHRYVAFFAQVILGTLCSHPTVVVGVACIWSTVARQPFRTTTGKVIPAFGFSELCTCLGDFLALGG